MIYDYEIRRSPFFATTITGLSPKPHIHPHLELIHLTQGSSTATVDGVNYLMQEGDMLFTFPNQIHFYNELSLIQGRMFIVHPDLFSELNSYFAKRVPVCPVIRKQDLPEDIAQRLEKIHTMTNSTSVLDHIAAKGLFLCLLAELLQNMETVPSQKDHDTVRDILVYCMSHYTEPLNLESLAEQLHLSKYYISHIFKNRLNVSFPDFINALRVEHACRNLTGERSVTDVAYSSGFNSIRSFNRNFEQHTGMTPTEYIRKNKL